MNNKAKHSPIPMIFLIILLFPVTLLAQSEKVQLRKQVAPAVMIFVAGACDGMNQILNFQYKSFKRIFPGANDRFWWPSKSYQNKYKNGDPSQGAKFPGSTTYLVSFSDGHHLTRFGEHLFLSGAMAFKIVQGQRLKWYWYPIEAVAYLLVNRIGFCAIYNTIK